MFVEPILSNVCGSSSLFANLEEAKIDSYFANIERVGLSNVCGTSFE